MRTTLIIIAVAAFTLIGVEGLMSGDYRHGVAGIALALANGLLLQ